MSKMQLFYIVILELECLLLLMFPQSFEGKIVGVCTDQEGTKCHGENKPWQTDGVCKSAADGRIYCVVPDTREFAFRVAVKMRSLRENLQELNSLWLRGSGPGMSWEAPLPLTLHPNIVDTWLSEPIHYISDSDGFLCDSLLHCSAIQAAMEFRIHKDEFGKEDMSGPNFYRTLPISNSMTGGMNFTIPQVTVFPWFEGSIVNKEDVEVHMSKLEKKRNFIPNLSSTLLFPPSFNYNVYKKYPLVIVFGTTLDAVLIIPVLEYLFVHEATVEEAVVVVVHPKDAAPYCHLNPFFSKNVRLVCVEPKCHTCMNCWDENRATPCDVDEYIEQEKQTSCVHNTSCNGVGSSVLEFIEKNLFKHVQLATRRRLLYDDAKQLSIIGFDGAGLLACYAAFAKPWVYANAGCFSPAFTWPNAKGGAHSYGMLETVQDFPENQVYIHTDQIFYIDHGEEDNYFFATEQDTHFTKETYRVMLEKFPMTKVVHSVMPGDRKSYYHNRNGGNTIYNRIKFPLLLFLKAEGGPSRKYARLVKASLIQEPVHVTVPVEPAPAYYYYDELDVECTVEQENCPLRLPLPVYLASVGMHLCMRFMCVIN